MEIPKFVLIVEDYSLVVKEAIEENDQTAPAKTDRNLPTTFSDESKVERKDQSSSRDSLEELEIDKFKYQNFHLKSSTKNELIFCL